MFTKFLTTLFKNLVSGDKIIIFREFAKEKERVESRAGFMALKEQQKLEKELTGLALAFFSFYGGSGVGFI